MEQCEYIKAKHSPPVYIDGVDFYSFAEKKIEEAYFYDAHMAINKNKLIEAREQK